MASGQLLLLHAVRTYKVGVAGFFFFCESWTKVEDSNTHEATRFGPDCGHFRSLDNVNPRQG